MQNDIWLIDWLNIYMHSKSLSTGCLDLKWLKFWWPYQFLHGSVFFMHEVIGLHCCLPIYGLGSVGGIDKIPFFHIWQKKIFYHIIYILTKHLLKFVHKFCLVYVW